MLTPEIVKARIEAIKAVMGDDEVAHSMEDRLHEEVLRAIATGTCVDNSECARLALTTELLNFNRWCA